MKDEALRLALEAFEYIDDNYMSLPAQAEKAIAAIKQALEQPEPEPRLWGCEYILGNRLDTFYTLAAAQKYVEGSLRNGAQVRLVGLYTSPPKREPLTDDAFDTLPDDYETGDY